MKSNRLLMAAAVILMYYPSVSAQGIKHYGSPPQANTMVEDDAHVLGHMKYHEEYRTWCQPRKRNKDGSCLRQDSCCDGRTVKDTGEIVGHCYPTEFRLNPKSKTTYMNEGESPSTYIAKLSPEDARIYGHEWMPVPDSKLVKEKNPDKTGGSAHFCTMNNSNAKESPEGYNSILYILCARSSTGVQ